MLVHPNVLLEIEIEHLVASLRQVPGEGLPLVAEVTSALALCKMDCAKSLHATKREERGRNVPLPREDEKI